MSSGIWIGKFMVFGADRLSARGLSVSYAPSRAVVSSGIMEKRMKVHRLGLYENNASSITIEIDGPADRDLFAEMHESKDPKPFTIWDGSQAGVYVSMQMKTLPKISWSNAQGETFKGTSELVGQSRPMGGYSLLNPAGDGGVDSVGVGPEINTTGIGPVGPGKELHVWVQPTAADSGTADLRLISSTGPGMPSPAVRAVFSQLDASSLASEVIVIDGDQTPITDGYFAVETTAVSGSFDVWVSMAIVPK